MPARAERVDGGVLVLNAVVLVLGATVLSCMSIFYNTRLAVTKDSIALRKARWCCFWVLFPSFGLHTVLVMNVKGSMSHVVGEMKYWNSAAVSSENEYGMDVCVCACARRRHNKKDKGQAAEQKCLAINFTVCHHDANITHTNINKEPD